MLKFVQGRIREQDRFCTHYAANPMDRKTGRSYISKLRARHNLQHRTIRSDQQVEDQTICKNTKATWDTYDTLRTVISEQDEHYGEPSKVIHLNLDETRLLSDAKPKKATFLRENKRSVRKTGRKTKKGVARTLLLTICDCAELQRILPQYVLQKDPEGRTACNKKSFKTKQKFYGDGMLEGYSHCKGWMTCDFHALYLRQILRTLKAFSQATAGHVTYILMSDSLGAHNVWFYPRFYFVVFSG